jgi:hypothetical protein
LNGQGKLPIPFSQQRSLVGTFLQAVVADLEADIDAVGDQLRIGCWLHVVSELRTLGVNISDLSGLQSQASTLSLRAETGGKRE